MSLNKLAVVLGSVAGAIFAGASLAWGPHWLLAFDHLHADGLKGADRRSYFALLESVRAEIGKFFLGVAVLAGVLISLNQLRLDRSKAANEVRSAAAEELVARHAAISLCAEKLGGSEDERLFALQSLAAQVQNFSASDSVSLRLVAAMISDHIQRQSLVQPRSPSLPREIERAFQVFFGVFDDTVVLRLRDVNFENWIIPLPGGIRVDLYDASCAGASLHGAGPVLIRRGDEGQFVSTGEAQLVLI